MSALTKLTADMPEREAKPLLDAYNLVLTRLGLMDRDDPLTLMIGKRVMKVARSGVMEPNAIAEQVLRDFPAN
ncbi:MULTISPECIES: hypothetical protein [Bradyrhizobium]|uniref:hypothetical protein n=1 Tax=Bradyrhizobium TaxID=374 RepID=UPI000487CA89|nr:MULTISPECIES: hypothetical protein [Bradyrhizobium]UFW45381.1 hypothetical protein BaraCB756_23930 [Bradyrhizobium arachidis]